MVVRMANVSNSNNICDNVVVIIVDDDDVTLIFHPIFFSVKL